MGALQAAPTDFTYSFGGDGWMSIWYLGVIKALIAAGAFKPGVHPVTGVSGGAQAAVYACSGVDPDAAYAEIKAAALKCISGGKKPPCRGELHEVTKGVLKKLLPADAADKCRGLITIGFSSPKLGRKVSKYDPQPTLDAKTAYQLSNFTTTEDLIEAVAASSFLHCLSDGTAYTTYRGRPTLAGGYSTVNFCPKSAGTSCIRINGGAASKKIIKPPKPAKPPRSFRPGFNGLSSAPPPPGSDAGARRMLLQDLPTSCPVALQWPTTPPRYKASIQPGKLVQMEIVWTQFIQIPVEWPIESRLQYAFKNGQQEGAAWATTMGFTAVPPPDNNGTTNGTTPPPPTDNNGTTNGTSPPPTDNNGTTNGTSPPPTDNNGTTNGTSPPPTDNNGTTNGTTPPPPTDNNGTVNCTAPPPPADTNGTTNGTTPPPPTNTNCTTPPPPIDNNGTTNSTTPPPPTDNNGTTNGTSPPPPTDNNGTTNGTVP